MMGGQENLQAAATEGVWRLSDLMMLALVESWSFESPVSEDGLLDLTSEEYDAIDKLCMPQMEALLPEFAEVDVDPASPTSGSAASNVS